MSLILDHIDEYSLSSVPISLISETGETIGNATGFFYRYNNFLFLISNWHVFSGREPATGQPKHSSGACPSAMKISIHSKKAFGSWFDELQLDLYEPSGKPIWIQHNEGQTIDIAAIKVSFEESNQNLPEDQCLIAYPINEMSCVNDMDVSIGKDVFILGFPLGLKKTGIFPVWKRGTIATEYRLKIDNNPQWILVDTATREGMSGAPVIMREWGGYTPWRSNVKVDKGLRAYTRFIGIYSGRFGVNKMDEAQLGIIWPNMLIDELLTNFVLGSYELKNN
jgi:hypothetical protein